jgi:hypothetical protein
MRPLLRCFPASLRGIPPDPEAFKAASEGSSFLLIGVRAGLG